jgi:hypothetical protein
MKAKLSAAILAGALLLSAPSGAGLANQLTYTETATIDGSLNGQSFAQSPITLTGTGDTANIVNVGGAFQLPLTLTFSIASVGSGTFGATSSVFSGGGLAGFEQGSTTILDTSSIFLSGYDLSTPIGPVAGTVGLTPGTGYSTTFGT